MFRTLPFVDIGLWLYGLHKLTYARILEEIEPLKQAAARGTKAAADLAALEQTKGVSSAPTASSPR